MVAHDLVWHGIAVKGGQPVRQLLVPGGAAGLGEPVVGRIADQNVQEPVRRQPRQVCCP